MATELFMVEGDTGPDRTFTVKRSGAIVDLTNAATVKLILKDTSTNQITNPTGTDQNCTIETPRTDGKVTYKFKTGHIASGNIHFGDIQITWSSGQVETDYDRVIVYVRPKVGSIS